MCGVCWRGVVEGGEAIDGDGVKHRSLETALHLRHLLAAAFTAAWRSAER
jgi:hypothetical protein